MDPSWRRSYGLRPTLRQLMIAVLAAALMSALIAPSLRSGLDPMAALLLPFSFPLLAALVFLLDRPGPAKYWLVGLLGSLFLPALALGFDLVVAAGGPAFSLTGAPQTGGLIVLAVV